MEPIFQALYNSIMEGDIDAVQEHIPSALDTGASPSRLLEEAMIPAMGEVGRLLRKVNIMCPRCW
jgi:methanogenic corrinoid protein MtbC1